MTQHAIIMPSAKPIQRSITSYENHGAFRWNKPAFQAFQLKPWNKDQEIEDCVKSSLGIYGPQSQIEMGRAKSVPARQKEQFIDRNDVRTAHSVANMCDMISLKPKSSLEALPTRPPLSKTKQIPGRYFPKATPIDIEKVMHFNTFRRYKAPVRLRTIDRPIGNSKSLDTSDLPMETVSFLNVHPKSSPQKTSNFGRQFYRMKRSNTEFPQIKSEVFAISFNSNLKNSRKPEDVASSALLLNGGNDTPKSGANDYDPISELHSDYYTIKRVSVATTNTAKSAPNPSARKSFSVVLRGLPKRLHSKLMLQNEGDLIDGGYLSKEAKSVVSCETMEQTPKGAPDSDVTRNTNPIPSVSSGGKMKVKIDGSVSLGPIMINGLS